MMQRLQIILLAFSFLLIAWGCSQQSTKPVVTVRPTPPIKVEFSDVTQNARINFKHNNGDSGLRLMPETNGSGVAFFDYDGDGFQDLFFVNSRDWTGKEFQDGLKTFPPSAAVFVKPPKPRAPSTCALYRNQGDGTFSDVTQGSGLRLTTYGMGVAVGDYDNDGRVDLYVTAYPRNFLFHNEGDGRFREVAAKAGVQSNGWGMCAAWLDYDKDGWLDLFVGRYIQWTPRTDVYQTSNGIKGYSNPQSYNGQSGRLYRGLGHGNFEDVSDKSGISVRLRDNEAGEPLNGKAMGVAVCDYNNDGWPDIIVANDTMPNYLFENTGKGTFRELAQSAGISHDQFGRARAGMGIDTADIDHSNRDSVVIGNFSKEMLGLYYNTGQKTFVDAAPNSVVGNVSRYFLTFGCLFFDYDNDGWSDILAANGHVQPDIEKFDPHESYRQRPLLLQNQRSKSLSFHEVGLQSGVALQKKIVARGLAYADYDLDGDLDVAITTNNGPAHLWRNNGGNQNNSIRLVLQGVKSNRSGIGTLVKAKVGNDVLRLWVRSGSSFLSQSELPVTLGLGQHTQVDGIAIHWPSGIKTKLENIKAGQIITVDEVQGLIKQNAFPNSTKK